VVAPTPFTAFDVSNTDASVDNEAPPSSSSAAPVRRVKELERESKEKEFVDGHYPNYIDGVWHCSNCGCPENIAIGRRKGPLGDKSQCGTCGTFYPLAICYLGEVVNYLVTKTGKFWHRQTRNLQLGSRLPLGC
jgi:SWI/SNF-related matrix-associated actin-dependent regulator of chromatin subfamily B protein 1